MQLTSKRTTGSVTGAGAGDLRVEGLAVPVLASQQYLLSQRDEAVYVRWGKEKVKGAGCRCVFFERQKSTDRSKELGKLGCVSVSSSLRYVDRLRNSH